MLREILLPFKCFTVNLCYSVVYKTMIKSVKHNTVIIFRCVIVFRADMYFM